MKELTIEEKARRYDEAIEQLRTMMPNWESLSYNGKTFLQDLVHIIHELKESAEINYRLWTIQDAKDGDVLVCEDFGYTSLMLFESFSNGRMSLHCWYNSQTNNFHINTDVNLRKDANIHPATKEQRDLLFQKMKESGYEWDAEKKELKKIKQPKLTEFEDAIKDMMDDYRDAIDDNAATVEEVKEKAAYLLSLIPCKPDWSEEDTQYINDTLALLSFGCSTHSVGEVQEWLQSLNNRVQPKQEWSEEDERNLQGVIDEIQANKNNAPYYDLETYDRFLNWLKSLKPHSIWKPSDEQIIALRWVLNNVPYNKHKEEISGLLEQIKDL